MEKRSVGGVKEASAADKQWIGTVDDLNDILSGFIAEASTCQASQQDNDV